MQNNQNTQNAQNARGAQNKHRNRQVAIAISLCFILFFKYLPAPAGMTTAAMQVVGIFIGSIILWMAVSIDWPSMLCIAALAFVPGVKFSALLTSSFGNSTFAFLLFTFMCTYTLSQTPFIRRAAVFFISSRMAQRGPWHFVCLYFASVLSLGAFMSPTVLVIIFLAITEEIFTVLGLEKGSRTACMMMMGMVFCSGISAGMTPIAHVFPLMGFGFYQTATGQGISYAHYMAAGIPVALLAFCAMVLSFLLLLRPDFKDIKTLDVTELKSQLGPMGKKERTTLVVFAAVVALWVLPGLVSPVLPAFSAYVDSFGTAMPPLLGAVVLAILTVDGRPILNFNECMGKGVPWASLIMTAGTLSLGSAMTNAEVGLTDWISSSIAPMAASLGPFALMALFVFWAAVQTNFSSNMVTVTVVCAIAIPISLASGAVSTPALVSVIGMMSSYAFATPPAMATVVFAIGSGWADTPSFAKYGFLLMFFSALLAIFVGYPIAAALMG